MIEARQIDVRNLRNLAGDALDESGRLKVMPASFYASTTVEERAALGTRQAAYVLPTVELVEWLMKAIGGRRAIEIGSGNGVLAEALGIPATDNCMQNRPEISMLYRGMGQAPIKYGRNVQPYPADKALKKFRPQVVVAAWVTHKFDPRRPEAEGNQYGVVEEDVIANCETYIFVGNRHVHRNKSVWNLPHQVFEPPWLYSRAHNGTPEFIAVWGKPVDGIAG